MWSTVLRDESSRIDIMWACRAGRRDGKISGRRYVSVLRVLAWYANCLKWLAPRRRA